MTLSICIYVGAAELASWGEVTCGIVLKTDVLSKNMTSVSLLSRAVYSAIMASFLGG
jgi:hypothetical protein